MYHHIKCTDSDVSLVLSRCMAMKIPNFHYNHSHQNRFCCYYIVFMFVIGNQFLHIYMEVVIYIIRCNMKSCQLQDQYSGSVHSWQVNLLYFCRLITWPGQADASANFRATIFFSEYTVYLSLQVKSPS